MGDREIVILAMEIIQEKLTDESKLDKLKLCQACLGVAKIMLEDTGHRKLGSTINTIGMLIQDDLNGCKEQ